MRMWNGSNWEPAVHNAMDSLLDLPLKDAMLACTPDPASLDTISLTFNTMRLDIMPLLSGPALLDSISVALD